MQCPQCDSTSIIYATRTPTIFKSTFVLRLAEDWPMMVCRRRECKACGKRWGTVEMPVDDLQLLLADVARQATQLMRAI
jgi:transcriptional regulator NrdR family protein